MPTPPRPASDLPQNTDPPRLPAGPEAPLWEVPTWGNLPPGVAGPEVTDFAGKAIYLYCFQSWCPGCHSRGFPTLQKVHAHYAGNDDVVFLAVQTVFEGFDTNRHELGVQTVTEKFGLDIPVGHSGRPDRPCKIMRNYRTGGTPWTLIIGPDRVLRYGDFHISAGDAIRLIDGLQP